MSRIGKKPVALPKGVTATVNGKTVSVKGPKGELKVTLVAEVDAKVDEHGVTLTPRTEPGALLTGTGDVVAQALRLATGTGRVESLCLHGDTPGAVVLARAVRAALDGAGIALAPFS